ncbi:hypothetical protein CTI12_AA307680 [Artemisia annua]|uniref:Uncharacterized protein n=1 Tax=Artemisia annua TaxID=35608 RepID=A0A2U1N547_ARTAN|nr:hypothetical protein CTI12_AA307680 [Artemisia annua]
MQVSLGGVHVCRCFRLGTRGWPGACVKMESYLSRRPFVGQQCNKPWGITRPTHCCVCFRLAHGLLPLLKKKAISVEGATLDNDHNVVSVCTETILTPALGGNSRLYQTISTQAACQSVPDTVYFPGTMRAPVILDFQSGTVLLLALRPSLYTTGSDFAQRRPSTFIPGNRTGCCWITTVYPKFFGGYAA